MDMVCVGICSGLLSHSVILIFHGQFMTGQCCANSQTMGNRMYFNCGFLFVICDQLCCLIWPICKAVDSYPSQK